MIIVTGGFGFIGSQIVKALVSKGKEVVVVDDLTDGRKFENLLGLKIKDYIDKDVFFEAVLLPQNKPQEDKIEAIIHNGAISSTTVWDGKAIMAANYDYSKFILEYCEKFKIPLIYASSASVYGSSKISKEDTPNKKPLNVYGYSKLLFDQFAFSKKRKTRIVGLRYFNCYGPGEQFKGSQASPFFRYYKSLKQSKPIVTFNGDDGFGGQAEDTRRDFVYVGDVVNVVLWALKSDVSGIYNVGTGGAYGFRTIAEHVLVHFAEIYKCYEEESAWIKEKRLPKHLRGRTQTYTCANLDALREAGYEENFLSIRGGSEKYLKWLDKMSNATWWDDENSFS